MAPPPPWAPRGPATSDGARKLFRPRHLEGAAPRGAPRGAAGAGRERGGGGGWGLEVGGRGVSFFRGSDSLSSAAAAGGWERFIFLWPLIFRIAGGRPARRRAGGRAGGQRRRRGWLRGAFHGAGTASRGPLAVFPLQLAATAPRPPVGASLDGKWTPPPLSPQPHAGAPSGAPRHLGGFVGGAAPAGGAGGPEGPGGAA